MNKFEKFTYTPRFCLFGILGSLITCMGCLITAIAYRGPNGERYSMFNYFISELGGIQESELAIVFNLGVLIGGLLMVIFLAGLGYHFTTKAGKLGSIVGVFSGVGGAFVGVFPFDVNITLHGVTAMGFFYGGMCTVVIFAVAIMIEKKTPFPKILALFGLIAAIIFGIFNLSLASFAGVMLEQATSINDVRPVGFWPMATFEWLSLLSVLFWIFTASVILMKTNKTQLKSANP